MEGFFNNILSSSQIVNSATILSLLLAIIFFFYQEWKQRNEQRKEVNRLKEEIINLVIRNHVNSGVQIIKINLEAMIDGFEKGKNCKLRFNKEDFVKMIYARVYENEHIPDNTRLELLKQLEEILNNYTYEINSNSGNNVDEEKLLAWAKLSSLVVTFTILFLSLVTVEYFKLKISNGLIISLLIFIPILIFLFFKPIIDKKLNSIAFSKINSPFSKKNTKSKANQEKNYNIPLFNLNKPSKEGLKFEEYFANHIEMKEILELRMLIEVILRDIYKVHSGEKQARLPIFKLISILKDENVIPENYTSFIKDTYFASSPITHEGVLPDNIASYEQIIPVMKDAVSLLYGILTSIKK